MSKEASGIIEASYTLDEFDDVVADGLTCGGMCGEELRALERVIDVRVPEFGDRALTTIHLRCYQGEDVLDTGEHR